MGAGRETRKSHERNDYRNLKQAEEVPKTVPEPYTVPKGLKIPTLGEQWRYVSPLVFIRARAHFSSQVSLLPLTNGGVF
jgi:hypothetical protein